MSSSLSEDHSSTISNSDSNTSSNITGLGTGTSGGGNITVRPAAFPDIARIARVAVDSLPDDPTFDYLWSHRHEYPEDNYFFWQQTLKGHLFNPRFTLLVATLTAPTEEKSAHYALSPAPPPPQAETIIAFGLWERNGRSRAARLRRRERNNCYNRLHRILTRLETWSLTHHYSRRDSNPLHLSAFSSVMSSVHSTYWTSRYPENFHLDLLCTLPAFRRRGAGTALTRWGIDEARREGAAVGVESSPMGLGLYEGLGFRLLEKMVVNVQGEDEELVVRVMMEAWGGDGIGLD
ncbi:hypothetical protein BZA05DRAFT_420660 [Tricharina praecox]|uniref:uncharacterized protein n=1 Tax=Tricharina praecox TaxID=43433 RepID=UPI00221E79AA|nr:uncharacterized protein BZA05DRAFT_420660 [Tricharina praecox]KAI5847616.1 hypothetical protein BZA05DRAFT_420660 [Tricharina praecox]